MPLALTAVFADLPDPWRETKNKLHRLTDILVIATCAVIAGTDRAGDVGWVRAWKRRDEFWESPDATRERRQLPAVEGVLEVVVARDLRQSP